MCAIEASVRSQPRTPREGVGLAESFLCLGLVLLPWLVLWWLLADLQGWPLNDDPFYAKPLAFWAEDGRVEQVSQYGYLTASSVAHIASGAIACSEGLSFRKLYLVCIAQQALAAVALYWFARQLHLSRAIGGLLAASLVSYPLYFGHAFTYMTDGPATAWSCLACIGLTLGYLQHRMRWLVAGALAVGWGYWIRQTNGVLLIAPSLLAIGTARLRWMLFGPMLVALLMILMLESSWIVPASSSRLADIAPESNEGYGKRVLIAVYGWMLLAGWYALPIAPWFAHAAWHSYSSMSPAERLACVSGSALTFIGGLSPFAVSQGRACLTSATGCFIQNGHFGPIFLSDMDEPGRWGSLSGVEWPLFFWQILSLLSIVSVSILGWWISWTLYHCLISWKKKAVQSPLVNCAVAWLVMLVGAVLAISLFIEPHMDRYWLFLMPVVSVLCSTLAARLKWRLERWTFAWGIGCVALQLWMSSVLVHDMLAWNNCRWQFIQSYLSAGHAADSIDGGRDVNAWLRMDEDPSTSARAGDESRWWSGRANVCVSSGPRPGWQVQAMLPWQAWATGRTHYLFILERSPLSFTAERVNADQHHPSIHSIVPLRLVYSLLAQERCYLLASRPMDRLCQFSF